MESETAVITLSHLISRHGGGTQRDEVNFRIDYFSARLTDMFV